MKTNKPKRFVYIELVKDGNKVNVYEDEYKLNKRVHSGNFELEKGGFLPVVEILHNLGYKKIMDVMYYGPSRELREDMYPLPCPSPVYQVGLGE